LGGAPLAVASRKLGEPGKPLRSVAEPRGRRRADAREGPRFRVAIVVIKVRRDLPGALRRGGARGVDLQVVAAQALGRRVHVGQLALGHSSPAVAACLFAPAQLFEVAPHCH
jgi:hypothetical protein